MLKRILSGLNSSPPYAKLATHLSTFRALRHISCWRCGRNESGTEKCQVCNATFDQTKINYFELFNLPINYDLSTTDVVVSYHKLQKQYHPDKHTNDTESVKEISEKFSTLANKAYKTLLSPIDRGVYMLSLHNIPLVMTSTDDPELLSDVLEIDVDIARSSKATGVKLKKKLSIELNKCKDELSTAFAEKRYDRAQKLLMKMRYFHNLMNKLKARLSALDVSARQR